MDKKVMDKIAEDYAKFNIPQEHIPIYETSHQFAQNFKKCSIVEYKNISYSNTATPLDKKVGTK